MAELKMERLSRFVSRILAQIAIKSFIILAVATLFSGCDCRSAESLEKPLPKVDSYERYYGQFVEFMPIYWDGNDYQENPGLLADSLFVNRISLVLSYYGIPSFRKSDSIGQSIWVLPDALENVDFVQSYTKKAQDTAWLHSHIGPF